MPIFDLLCAPYQEHVRYFSCTVPPERDGTEAGNFLRHGLGFSAALIKRAKHLADGIAIDGQRITTRTALRAGQLLQVRLSDHERRSDIFPEDGPLDIVYEDEDLLVLNKPPRMTVHPDPLHNSGTLGNFLLAYYDRHGIPADFHPVHRLDRGTSGVMVVAKHAYAQELLRRALHSGDFQRSYLAVCDGCPPAQAGRIDLPIAHSMDSMIRQEIRPDGAPACTEYTVLRKTAERSLVRLVLQTGRTHQIRVHMAAIGCPLTGDFLYGTENQALISRPALHSHTLSFRHPLSRQQLSFEVPLPEDMAHLL